MSFLKNKNVFNAGINLRFQSLVKETNGKKKEIKRKIKNHNFKSNFKCMWRK